MQGHRVGGILFSDQENWAQNGQGLSVDSLTPEYVAENMEVMSTVVLSDIEVTAPLKHEPICPRLPPPGLAHRSAPASRQ